jgi:hypothetical protein
MLESHRFIQTDGWRENVIGFQVKAVGAGGAGGLNDGGP